MKSKKGYCVSKSYTVTIALYCWSYIVYNHPQTHPNLRMPNYFLYLHNITEYTLLERYKYLDRKRHLRLSQRCYWKFKSTGKRRCAFASAVTDVSEDLSALMLRVKQFQNSHSSSFYTEDDSATILCNVTVTFQKMWIFNLRECPNANMSDTIQKINCWIKNTYSMQNIIFSNTQVNG